MSTTSVLHGHTALLALPFFAASAVGMNEMFSCGRQLCTSRHTLLAAGHAKGSAPRWRVTAATSQWPMGSRPA